VSDVEPDLEELLRRRADDMRLPLDIPPATLQRARRRRGLTASLAALTTLVVVAGSVVGLQAIGRAQHGRVGESPKPGPSATGAAPTQSVSGPTPTATASSSGAAVPGSDEAIREAIWPVSSQPALDSLEQRIADGGDAYVLTPADEAVRFAAHVMGWNAGRVGIHDARQDADGATVVVWNEDVGAFSPGIASTISLRPAPAMADGRTPWLVTRATTGFFTVGCPSLRQDGIDPRYPLAVCGLLTRPPVGWTATASVEYVDSELEPSEAASTAGLTINVWQTIHGKIQFIATYPNSDVSFAVRLFSRDGTVLGMDARRMVVTLSGGQGVIGELPSPAAGVRRSILDAVHTGSYAVLEPLIGPGFRFTSGAVPPGNPAAQAIGLWKRQGPVPLGIMGDLLEMPFGTERSSGTVVDVWPAVATYTPDQLRHLAPEWRSALRLIYPDLNLRLRSWIRSGGYTGWRLGITADGRWSYFLSGR
jgi:hypothetical protein